MELGCTSRYLDVEEIIEDLLLYQLTEKDKLSFKQYAADELISLHHNLGQAIRNYYRLWESSNPFVAGEGKHADDVSMTIIERTWSRLTNQPVPKHPEIIDNGNGTYTVNGVDIELFVVHVP